MVYFFLFLLGIVVGSFLSVVVYREVNEVKNANFLPGWVWGRSICDHCRRKLLWYDNIPLFSYLLLKGKCRWCHQPISFQYPLIELLTGLEFVWLYWILSRFAFFGQIEGFYSLALAGYWFFIFSVSVVLALVDWKTQILPDTVLLPAIVLAILRLFITHQWQFLFSAFIAGLFFLSLFLVTRGKGIGFGDVKLGFFMGLVLGWWQRVIVAIFLAFLTGAIVGVIVVILKKKTLKSAIAFGPFLLWGMWLAKLWGDQIWNWYWRLIH
ncbi:hypothetical protein A2160_05975 [Candidatus Beckwithbacteria bacterium RBG_13_42_9]|uniref:Prepilin peptidase n=1 Tax=Candidatus Beckwithbacteria bacterium RBG_13_42_9 TaxID=1797457 RepID=A0A1F5E590_9BACT|nr:MAG: hypothetical protein A2160_05975 [Candidatus Beckwithbacteria bacterium RBG_13_42_9]